MLNGVNLLNLFLILSSTKKGKKNIVVDALSRCHALLSQLDAKILGLENIKDLYATNSFFAEPFTKCCDGKGWKKFICMMDFYLELTNSTFQIALFA